jgi:Carboxypeptidase regulatory-like domain/TonB dependent receptor
LRGQTEHQVLRLEEVCAEGQTLQQGTVDLWRDGDGERYLRRFYNAQHQMVAAEWRGKDGSHHSYRTNRDQDTTDIGAILTDGIWNQDVSARAFNELAKTASQLNANNGGNELTVSGPTAGLPHLISATLTLDRHRSPLREVLRIREGSEIHEIRFAQTDYERKPIRSVPDDLFMQDVQGSDASGPSDSKSFGNVQRSRFSNLGSDVQLAELQIAVLYQLNQIGADTGDPIEIVRTADRRISVSGTISDDARRRAIFSRLASLPNHQSLDVKLISPRDIHIEMPAARSSKLNSTSVFDSAQTRPLVDSKIREHFQERGLSGQELSSAISSFSRDALFWILFIYVYALAYATAQTSSANVTGTVEDSSGARIPDASIVLINTLTGTENDTKTSHLGVFVLPGVIPGKYTLQIERQGFATALFTGVVLNVGDTKDLVIKLKIGTVTESAVIEGAGITLNSMDASVSTVVNRKFVGNIPLNGRSFQDLISMTAGIVTESPQSAGLASGGMGAFSVNGQRTNANSITVDGVSGDVGTASLSGREKIVSTGSTAGLTAAGTTQSVISLDALQEFRVLSSTYTAEYGQVSGGQITFLTRSGTDSIHGSLYDYARNSITDTSDWFTGSYLPGSFHQNDYGGTLGAPLFRAGKTSALTNTFLFLSFEGLHLAQPTPPTFEYVPSLELRNEAPLALQPILNDFPIPTGYEIKDVAGNPSGLASIGVGPFSLPGEVKSTSIRLDHIFAPRISAFFRYGNTPSSAQSRQLSSLTTEQINVQSATLGATIQVSNSKSNEFRLGYAFSSSALNTQIFPLYFGPNPIFDFNQALGIPASSSTARGDAYIRVAGVGDSGINTDDASSSLSHWDIRDTFTLQIDKHLVKAGIDLRHIISSVTPAALSVEADFFDRNSMATNLASDIVVTKSAPSTPTFNDFSVFLQDEWRLFPSLTFSLGLRWEINPPPNGKSGNDAYTLLGNIDDPGSLTLAPRGTPLWRTSLSNFAPRIGAAWIVNSSPGKETIVRAGSGLFFDTGNEWAAAAFSGLGFTASSYQTNVPVPVADSQLDFSIAPIAPYTHSTVYAFPSDLGAPFSIQWSLSVERALGRSQSLTASYIGADVRRVLEAQRKDVSYQNPDFGYVYYFPGGVTSNYSAFQVKFQRSMTPGIQALASYVWAHTLDYGSTAPAFPLVYGNSNLDVRHNLQAALAWDQPTHVEKPLMKQIFAQGWGIDGRFTARSSFPLSPLGNMLSDPETGTRYYSGVDLIPHRPLYLSGPQFPGGRALNGGPSAAEPAFVLPTGNLPGNAPRNLSRGFPAIQLNLGIQRGFNLGERLNFQFRGEAFNVFNHPNFGFVDPYVTDAKFGQATHMLNQSFGSVGALYQQGGPRSIQLSLKMTF